MTDIDANAVGRYLGLLVHDLRNPAATLSANIDFLREVGVEDEDAREAIDDMVIALGEFKRGLEQVAYVARDMSGQRAAIIADADLRTSLPLLAGDRAGYLVKVEFEPEDSLVAVGGSVVPAIVELLVANSKHHVRRGEAVVRASRQGEDVVVEVVDGGTAIAPELREVAFTLAGQQDIKGRADGRYSRFGGLVAAEVLARAAGAELTAAGEDGAAVFRLSLRGA